MATEKFSLDDSFTLRGESYKIGMLLLIKHLNDQDWKLGNKFSVRLDLISNKIETLYKKFKKDLEDENTTSFKIANVHFNKLIVSYISILDDYTTLKDPFQSLCDAERYSVLLKGRRSFETPVTFSTSEDDNNPKTLNISLSEKPINDKKLLFSEYSADTCWFNSLTAWQKSIIDEITKKLRDENQEESPVFSIPSSLRNIPGLANASFHECKIDDRSAVSYFRHATQLPIDLLGKKRTEDEQFRLTCLNLASQIRQSIEKTKTQDESKFPDEVVILTQSLVSPGKAANLKAKFISVPSDNDTQIYELKEKAVHFFQNALANPDVLIQNEKIKSLFFTSEEREQKEGQLYYKDFLEKWGLIAQDNKTFKYENQKPIRITLLSTNHPLNVLRHLEAYTFQNESNECNTALLLGAVARHLKSLMRPVSPKINGEENWPQLEECINQTKDINSFNSKLNALIKILKSCEKEKKVINHREPIVNIIKNLLGEDIKVFLDENTLQLLHALHSLLSIPNGQGVLTSDERHKPQLRSIAEVMIINCLKGVAWIACKSGKDRTGAASIAIDAAAIYYQQNEKFPHYYDDEIHRKNYLNSANELYNSGHHQKMASENAPGAKGLLRPDSFFPKDLKLDGVQLQTRLAGLNKPKVAKKLQKGFFNHRVLNEDLKDVKDRAINLKLEENPTLIDWQRNWENYFINGESVKELRENKGFKDEEDLSTFIETHLLAQIENQELKKYYKALILYSFHQGGFPHTFAKVSMELINNHYVRQGAIIEQPDMQINFSWPEEGNGIQIEEINTYEGKKDYTGKNEKVIQLEKGDYYCQTQSCILLNLSEAKDNACKLTVNIRSASVDCADELKPIFFNKSSNLLEALIYYIHILLETIKCFFDADPLLNESWLSKTNSTFFQKLAVTTKNEDENQAQSKNIVRNIV